MKINRKILPIVVLSFLLVSCKTPTSEVVYYAKIKTSQDNEIKYYLAANVEVRGEQERKSVSVTTYKTKTEGEYFMTDEKIDQNLFLVLCTPLTKALSNVTVKVKDVDATLKYSGIPSLTNRYYVYEIQSFSKNEDFEIVATYKKEDYVSNVTYTKHNKPDNLTNYEDLYASVTLNDIVLKKGEDTEFKISEMDDVILSACEQEGKTDTSGVLKINANKGLKVKLFYKKNAKNINDKIFSFKAIKDRSTWSGNGEYKERTYYKNEDGEVYHTYFKFAPNLNNCSLQFNFDYSSTKGDIKLSDKNFKDITINGTTIYNNDEKKLVDVGQPTITIDGSQAEKVTLADLNDSSIKQIALTYTKSQIVDVAGGDISKIEDVIFNDDQQYGLPRKSIESDKVIVYLKNISDDQSINLPSQYPFEVAMGSDGYGIIEDNPLDLKIKLVRY